MPRARSGLAPRYAAAARGIRRTMAASSWCALLLVAAFVAPAASEAQDAAVRRNAATLPFEHGLVVIDAHGDGKVVIGASAGDSTIATPFPGAEVKAWADSTARLLARRVPRSVKQRVYRSGVVNRETSAGVSFTRRISAGESKYSLFFANSSYGGFPLEVSRAEAEQFVKALGRASTMARELSSPPRSKRR